MGLLDLDPVERGVARHAQRDRVPDVRAQHPRLSGLQARTKRKHPDAAGRTSITEEEQSGSVGQPTHEAVAGPSLEQRTDLGRVHVQDIQVAIPVGHPAIVRQVLTVRRESVQRAPNSSHSLSVASDDRFNDRFNGSVRHAEPVDGDVPAVPQRDEQVLAVGEPAPKHHPRVLARWHDNLWFSPARRHQAKAQSDVRTPIRAPRSPHVRDLLPVWREERAMGPAWILGEIT